MSQLKFGDYISVEQKRFGVANEHYTHKVIRTLQSNSWTAVPVHVGEKSSLHESIEDVVECICCGVDESKVVRYRIEDVKFLRSDAHDKELEISAYQLSQKNIINAFGISGEGAHSKLVIEYVHGLVAESVALKKFIVDECVIPHEFYGDNKDAADFMPATPNTDAAIAEIKLKTIRELVSKVSEDLKQKGQSARRIEHLDFTWAYIETARAEMHNANLRAGRKG